MMKAAICCAYGEPEVLRFTELEKPAVGKHELLVRNYATAVHSADVRIRRLDAKGYLMKCIMRLALGFNKPRNPVLGVVFAGVVEQTGSEVSTFAVGDEVYGMTGMKMGTYAQYVTVSENGFVTLKPSGSTFEEAAALPFGGQAATYFLGKAGISTFRFPKVLVYGASGAVGSAAVQIARYYGAYVTAVCSTFNQKMVEGLGANQVLPYDQSDFAMLKEKYDIIFDAVGKITREQCSSMLAGNGKFVTVGGMSYASEKIEQLQLLSKLYEAGKLQASIDKVLPFEKLVEAHRYVETGRKRGNVVMRLP